jgi:hypothetical protein
MCVVMNIIAMATIDKMGPFRHYLPPRHVQQHCAAIFSQYFAHEKPVNYLWVVLKKSMGDL